AAIRDARLNGALIYLDNADALRRDTGAGAARLRAPPALMPRSGRLLFLATERVDRIDIESVLDLPSLEIPTLTSAERRKLWRTVISEKLDPGEALVSSLVAHFPMNPGDITAVRPDVAALARVSGDILER